MSLAFVVSAGFLGLHALATPGVLLGANPGFELATPVGLLLGGLFVAVSGLEFGREASDRIVGRARLMLGVLVALMALWATFSLARLPPLDAEIAQEELNGWQTWLGAVGVLLYAVGAAGYARLYRRRGSRFLFAVTSGFALLAAAMIVIAFAENWRISWWEWHLLMLSAFLLIAAAARSEWHEERFSALYLEQTLAGARDASVLFADLAGFTSLLRAQRPGRRDRDAEHVLRAAPARAPGARRRRPPADRRRDHGRLQQGRRPAGARAPRCSGRAGAPVGGGVVAASRPDWPRFRVGVNSGVVQAAVIGGESGHRKHGLVGDTVNLAARLESEASVGEVVIGAGTLERLPESATVRPLQALRVKGKEAAVEAYVLVALP